MHLAAIEIYLQPVVKTVVGCGVVPPAAGPDESIAALNEPEPAISAMRMGKILDADDFFFVAHVAIPDF